MDAVLCRDLLQGCREDRVDDLVDSLRFKLQPEGSIKATAFASDSDRMFSSADSQVF